MRRHPYRRTALRLLSVPTASLLVLLPGGGAAPAAPPPGAGAEFPRTVIDALLEDPRTAGARTAVVVRDADTGAVLYDRSGRDHLTPAQTLMIATSAAALERLGPRHEAQAPYRWRTEVVETGGATPGTVDLVLRGHGDPTTTVSDYRDLAEQVADVGITTVTGDLVIASGAFGSLFSPDRYGTGWTVDDLGTPSGAPVSELTLSPDPVPGEGGVRYLTNTVRLTVEAGVDGWSPPTVTIHPASPAVPVDPRAITSSETRTVTYRNPGDGTLVVDGWMAPGADPVVTHLPVPDPHRHVGEVFAAALTDAGVEVLGDLRVDEEVHGYLDPVADHSSPPITEMARHLLRHPNAPHAEAWLRSLGREHTGVGTAEQGLTVMAGALADLGLAEPIPRQADGSGLSRDNLVEAHGLTDVLLGVRDAFWYPAWRDALPTACAADGALAERLCEGPAAGVTRAVPGELPGVEGLVGYTTDAGGRELAFAVLLNGVREQDAAREVVDSLVTALAGGGTTPPKPDPGKPGKPGGPGGPREAEAVSHTPTVRITAARPVRRGER
ncbi:D-alanyl-D-alanine carboxypeptidase/D-alanyl-D-alanine-endopeptidase [Streptomyces alkaliphilus]|uniref:D-alanyl-D-alanine carboxypeptidase/D-alanyl-D-alanine-endopeptidase n=1 Tax=Streptomyces alkaliphilus TaxID=1472722 RepID=A0A7W3TAN0_9ACTN|nr:D-alanyl-D-alanine carboxypeptidase/D-alanyl-D-alanine-endopeptidase [Streptomyces alkaliphilus]MBB0243293.1 D-alanyl-D-alanine carboxypeptidase/D-alanyl-D-alanine-endopeptidase [Streptomyces alkaliphilus]